LRECVLWCALCGVWLCGVWLCGVLCGVCCICVV
jgi:hypothetical protein